MAILLSNLNRFKKNLFTGRFLALINLLLNGYEKSHRTLHMLLPEAAERIEK